MFACESLLKNASIATLELYNNQPRWWIKDAILTDRALYLFQEKGDLLGDEYDKLEISQFRSNKISKDEEPHYLKQLPPFKQPYNNVVEMLNKKTQKRRVLACDSPAAAEEFLNLLNLVNSYLNYELLFNSTGSSNQQLQPSNTQGNQNQDGGTKGSTSAGANDDQQNNNGPVFITTWVQTYPQHNGLMQFHEEFFDPENFPYLLSFGRENEAIKNLLFDSNFLFTEPKATNHIQQVLSTFSRESVIQMTLRGNQMSDYHFKQLSTSIQQYEKIQTLELSNNSLGNQALETLGVIFSNCPLIQKLLLQNNLFGSGVGTQPSLDYFLTQLFTELDAPQHLDLSDNQFNDESLAPFVKYIFANEDCNLQVFNLENNSFSSYGKRTLLKAYSMCQNKQHIQFKCGPMPFTEATLKHAFNVQFENKQQMMGNGNNVVRTQQEQQQKFLKTMNMDKLELRIVRKPNYGSNFLRGLPINRADRERLFAIFGKIEIMVSNRHNVFIEDIRDLLLEITQLNFEFPRHKLESLFDLVNEKLNASIECENIYCLEVLLDCLRFMSATNKKALDKYQELSVIAALVAKDLLKVINMELLDDNELNVMLDNALNEAKRIGMRGEIIDAAMTLKTLRNNFLTEMQNKSSNSDDEAVIGGGEDQQQLEFYDEDKTMNVYDEKYDVFIEMSPEELGLTSEVEPNLGFHPYSTDYLKISNLNLNYVRKNLKEAQKFLKDEESYSYRNIFDRCYFLLTDSSIETPLQSKAYNLAKNDNNLKIARVIFRYRNNLDNLFPSKMEATQLSLRTTVSQGSLSQNTTMNSSGGDSSGRRKSIISKAEDVNTAKIYQYKSLLAKEYLEFNNTKLSHPVSKIDKNKAPVAVVFNRNLYSICESEDLNKNTFYSKIQDLFEEFIIKQGRLQNEELTDEFFLQIFRQINRKNQSEKAAKSIANAFFILALLTRYSSPSKDLLEGYEQWVMSVKEKSGQEFQRIMQIILTNFSIVKKPENMTSQQIKPYINWPPCFAEIESIITGEPIQIQVFTPMGDIFQYTIDETTTVETLLQHIWKEKFFSKEPDPEFYWLYQHVDKPDHFDQPLSKDKKILKLLYKNEKQSIQNAQAQVQSMDDGRRFSFIKKKSAKFLRKQTIVSSMEALSDNEYQSTIFLIRKRIFTSLHHEKNVKTLAKKALNFLYHQVRIDYIEKNVLRKLCNYEDVSALGALILKVKYWGKILRSKDNSLTKELIIKNIEYAIPFTLQHEKRQDSDYWVQKIQKDFDRYNMRELSIEEAQEKFLNLFSTYDPAYSSYYVLKATPNSTGENLLKQLEMDDSDDLPSMVGGRNSTVAQAKDSFLHLHMNHDLLCVINFYNGISFYENKNRNKVIAKISFEEILYVMGSSDTFKIGYINSSHQAKNLDIQLELFTLNNQSAQPIAEDIIAYCQLHLAECTKNDSIEIVRRNIINIFEDMEDPFGTEEEQMSPYGQAPVGGQQTNQFRKSQLPFRKSQFLGNFDLGDGENEGKGSPEGNSKLIQTKLMQKKGHQFRMKEKFLIYLKRCPLYQQKITSNHNTAQTNADSQGKSDSRSSSHRAGSSASGSLGGKGLFNKLQLATHRIEEDKDEDEDDSSYVTNEGEKEIYNSKKSERSFKSYSPISQSQQSQKTGKGTNHSRASSNQKTPTAIQRPTKKAEEEFSNTQQNVMNELFKRTVASQDKRKSQELPSFFVKKTESAMAAEDEREAEPVIMAQKINYNELDKDQKKQKLQSTINAAFSSLPPPPPPMKF